MSNYDREAIQTVVGYLIGYGLSTLVGILVISRIMAGLANRYLRPTGNSSKTPALITPKQTSPASEPMAVPSEKPKDEALASSSVRVDPNYQTLATIIGSIEGAMYTTSILVGHPEFIGVWLVLKAVGEWRKGDNTSAHANALVGTSGEYTIFLIGNALNVILSVVTAALLKRFVPAFPTFAHWTW